MGFELIGKGRWVNRYERLTSCDENVARSARRCCLKKVNGRFKGLRISRSKKLNWKPFSLVLLPRKIGTMYDEIVKRLKMMDDVCPTIVFSCHWGLPVLSHSTSVHCRKSSISLTCY